MQGDALLFAREFSREYDRWSLSRAEVAEASPADLYVMIAAMIKSANVSVLTQPAEDTTRATGRNASK